MFVSFMKISACWLLHRLIKFNKICWEKRPAKPRPNLRTSFCRRDLKNTQPYLKGGPEPLENEINKILGSKREDQFSDHFSDLVQNICSVRYSYLLRLSIFCKAPWDMRKFPQKCQKIAGCWESAVYGSRPLIASKPDSSPLKRLGLDNITSQPWSDTTCPCTTSTSAYLRFVTIFLLEKTRQSTRSGCTGASCVRPWLTRDIV